MSNCKYLKQKLNRKLECKLKDKIITLKDCSNCNYKEYHFPDNGKIVKSNNHQMSKTIAKHSKNGQNKAKIKIKSNKNDLGVNTKSKSKSNKLAKLERNRTSLFTDDLEHCIICGKSKDNLHEIFFGKNRINSIKYKLVIPLCFECHFKIHNNINLQNEWHKKGQLKFDEIYPNLDFIEIFKKNWLN